MAKNPNGADGIGVLLRVMMDAERSAATYGAALGLDPMSAKKLHRVGVYGPPVGAASAPDRVPRVLRAVPAGERRPEPPVPPRRGK